MKRVFIVGDGRIGQFIASNMKVPFRFLGISERPHKESTVFLAIGEKQSIQWIKNLKNIHVHVYTNCSVKSRIDKIYPIEAHIHILFNPAYQQTGNIIVFPLGVGADLLKEYISFPFKMIQMTAKEHDSMMALQQKYFHSTVRSLGKKLSTVKQEYRTASVQKFFELYQRVESLGPDVIKEIMGNPQRTPTPQP